ncbi:MAG: alpha/beta fold hydrolase [Steroidobacteraceae bacterium]
MAARALKPQGLPAAEAARAFRPPRLLRNAHLQSVLSNLPWQSWFIRRRAQPLLASSREMLLDCGDGVRLQAFYSARPEQARAGLYKLAVLLHGWEGSAQSSYVLSCAALLFQRGFAVVRLNLRDHGSTHALNRDLFHSCRLPEVIGAIRALSAAFPQARLCLAGFSLGGNFMLRVAADSRAPQTIAGVVAISPVIDPQATLRALEQGLGLYRRYFVRRWSRSLRIKQRAWPGAHDFADLWQLQDLRQMTAALVRRYTEFETLEAYLDGYALTGERLASLRAPASILLSADDPIIPAADLERLAHSELLTLVRTEHGGHCGFMQGWSRPSFADGYVLAQFEQFSPPGERAA